MNNPKVQDGDRKLDAEDWKNEIGKIPYNNSKG